MQGTLTTSLPLVSVIGIWVAKTDASFLAWYRYLHSDLSYCSYNTWLYWHYNLGSSSFSFAVRLWLHWWYLPEFVPSYPAFQVAFSFSLLYVLILKTCLLLPPGQSRFYFFYFRFFLVEVIGGCSLGLHLWGNAVRRAVTSEATDIRVLDHGARS